VRRFPFVQLDVFSATRLEGNPLAVFTDGHGLSDAEMQALAREMNLSETTFILPRSAAVERSRGVQVRIFTPEEELPFAGHPTLGTAVVLRKLGRVRAAQKFDAGRSAGLQAGMKLNAARSKAAGLKAGATRPPEEVLLDLKVGRIPVTFHEEDGQVFGEMRQREPKFGVVHDRWTVARLAGLKVSEIATDLPVETVSTGVAFAIVPVKSLRALSELRLDWKTVSGYLERRSDAQFFYFVTRETQDPAARLHARMIFYNGEDPATGSAAGCAAAWMVRHGIAQADEHVLIEQGIEAKRPSRIFVRAGMKGDRITNVRVGGHAVEVLRGEVVL
jgi:trans-2,3-dihydro-3-hydroxyanthranilate isomerase